MNLSLVDVIRAVLDAGVADGKIGPGSIPCTCISRCRR